MLYAIIATDVANSLEARLAARPAHLDRLRPVQAVPPQQQPGGSGMAEQAGEQQAAFVFWLP